MSDPGSSISGMSSAVGMLTDEALLAAWTDLEVQRRQLTSAEHALIAEVEQRGLARARGMRSTAVLATRLLRISSGEARARVTAAADLGPRRGLTGEPLEPIYPLVAAAQSEGAISAHHAKVIVDTVEALPDPVRKEYEDQVEADLVGLARQFDPAGVAKAARHVRAILDPDGSLEDIDYRRRRRHFDLHRRADGSGYGSFELDPECAEHLQTVFDTLAAPRPAADGTPDRRTAGQRRHDALLELCQLGMRARLLPSCAGVTTTVVLTGDVEAFRSGEGTVRTGTGAVLPAAEARRWITGDARFFAAVVDKATHRLTSYSTGTRLFTE